MRCFKYPCVDSITITGISVKPKNGTATLQNDGSISYVPRSCYAGSDTFTYDVKDTVTGDSETIQVSVVVDDSGLPVFEGAVNGVLPDQFPDTPIYATDPITILDGNAEDRPKLQRPNHNGDTMENLTGNEFRVGKNEIQWQATSDNGCSTIATQSIRVLPTVSLSTGVTEFNLKDKKLRIKASLNGKSNIETLATVGFKDSESNTKNEILSALPSLSSLAISIPEGNKEGFAEVPAVGFLESGTAFRIGLVGESRLIGTPDAHKILIVGGPNGGHFTARRLDDDKVDLAVDGFTTDLDDSTLTYEFFVNGKLAPEGTDGLAHSRKVSTSDGLRRPNDKFRVVISDALNRKTTSNKVLTAITPRVTELIPTATRLLAETSVHMDLNSQTELAKTWCTKANIGIIEILEEDEDEEAISNLITKCVAGYLHTSELTSTSTTSTSRASIAAPASTGEPEQSEASAALEQFLVSLIEQASPEGIERLLQAANTDTDLDGIADLFDSQDDAGLQAIVGTQDDDPLASLQRQLGNAQMLMATDTGGRLTLGTSALTADRFSVLISPDDVTSDNGFTNVGGLFDFVVSGSGDTVNQSFRVSIPQITPIPANAVYRKLNTVNNVWTDFIQDADNSIWSAPANAGICPSPGKDVWIPGLNEGHWCVRLIIEDGGPNDDDGIVNGYVADPGGVAVQDTGNHAPVAVDDEATILFNAISTVDVLGNDSDEDDDLLVITSSRSILGDVSFTDSAINYTPAFDFVGTDKITYAISDRQGGTALATVSVTVLANQVPVAVNDETTTQTGSAVIIDVLSNDTDPDGDELVITQASAENGTITINDNGSLRYVSSSDFNGTDTVSYTIADTFGQAASASVSVVVTQPPAPVAQSSGGGGGGCSVSSGDGKVDPLFYLMLFTAFMYLLRTSRRNRFST
jgi:hypothetical protein